MRPAPNDSTRAVQEQLTNAVRAYASEVADNPGVAPLAPGHDLTQTDILRAVDALLEEADVEVFELAMWRLWSRD